MSLDRRSFIAATALPLALGAVPGGADPPPPGRIMRTRVPVNLETDFAALDGFLTPARSFYVRNHFAAPTVDPDKWRLKVEGAVEKSLELSLDDLKKMPATTAPVTLECTGNGRVYLTPPARGVNWQLGAVGTAEWTGVALSEVLRRAGAGPAAAEVVLEGADTGTVSDPASPGPIAFARSLPLEKALKPEVRLVWAMNGEPLPAEHGGPVRVVVGGWYGMASVKWLTGIVAVTKPFAGFWQTFDYTVFEKTPAGPSLVPVGAMPVKSQLARPALGEVVPAGKPYRVFGAAWAGEDHVKRVAVSTDGGKSWDDAKLLGDRVPFCWRLFEYDWKSPAAGRAILMARAEDEHGRAQPMERDPMRRNYMITHVLPVEVEVR